MEALSNYSKETRPWGEFERYTLNEQTTVKTITVNAGEAFSLQTHAHRNEFWHILSGDGTITIGPEEREARVGDHFMIPAATTHRMEGGPEGIRFLEIAFGDFDEADITRLADKYGRV